MKIKITEENQPCRKCGTPVKKQIPHTAIKEDQEYYYEYYFKCLNCNTVYMVNAVKVIINKSNQASNTLIADNK